MKQRWIIVESEKRKQSDLQQIEKRLAKKLVQAQARLKQLNRQKFACEPDAQQAVQRREQKITILSTG